MKNIDEYKYLWDRDKRFYALLKTSENDLPAIYHTYHHSMLLINENIEVINAILNKMKDAGTETFTGFEALYKKYPPISNEERRRRMKEFPDPNLN